MYSRAGMLGALPAGMAGNYTPTAAELGQAQAWADANQYGTVQEPWNLAADGSTFTVPTSSGAGSVRFGFGRGWFASFPGPGAAGAAPAADVAVPAPGAAMPIVQAAVESAPVPVAATVTGPGGAAVPVEASLQTSAIAASAVPVPAPSGAGGFNFNDFLSALLNAPALQGTVRDVSQAVAPVAQQAASAALSNWLQAHKTQLVVGGLAIVGLIIVARRRG